MKGEISYILETIFLGFSLFYFILFIFQITVKSSNRIFNSDTCKSIINLSKYAAVVFIVLILYYLFEPLPAEDKYRVLNRAFGPYWYWFWLYVTTLSLSLLLWNKRISESSTSRFLISIAMLIGLFLNDAFAIDTIIQSRDYLATSITVNRILARIVAEVLIQLVIFGGLVALINMIRRKVIIY